MRVFSLVLAVCLSSLLPAACNAPQPIETTPQNRETSLNGLDLENEDDRKLGFLMTRGSVDPNDEVVFSWNGNIFADIPAQPETNPERQFKRPILTFQGYNIARFIETEEGHRRMLSREISLYGDSQGRIIDCWTNPWTGQNQTVVHVANDPVDFTFSGSTPYEILGDHVAWTVEVSLSYPSPLTTREFPQSSAGNTYESTELFTFFTALGDLRRSQTSAPAWFSWTRIGQWLPWMGMAQRPGRLLFHAQGQKLEGGFQALPESIRQRVLEEFPEFATAPEGPRDGPNQTSWTRFRDLSEAGEIPTECEPVLQD